MLSAKPPSGFRELFLPVYLPTFLFAVGQGAVLPVIPLFARELGASVAVAGLIVALRGIGTMVFDVPAGMLVSRFGERNAMVIATFALAITALGASLSPSIAVYGVLIFVMGCGWSVWLLGRLSYVTDAVPGHQRGRALSLLGGSNRIGNFAGPFIGGFAAISFGLEAAFVIQAVLAIAASAVLYLAVREPQSHTDVSHGGVPHSVPRILRENANVFLTAGTATIAIQVLRTGRQVIIPLWGESIGLDAAQIGVIFGISSGLDMVMFYPVGIVMDRWGRKVTAVPCLLFMSAGLFLVPLTNGFLGLTLAGLLIGFGNGMGSGIVMTLGADFSPTIGRGEFLGVWRLIGDIGTAGGPVVVSAVAGASTLGFASIAAAAIGVAGAGVMALFVTEPLRRYAPAVVEVEPGDPGAAS